MQHSKNSSLAVCFVACYYTSSPILEKSFGITEVCFKTHQFSATWSGIILLDFFELFFEKAQNIYLSSMMILRVIRFFSFFEKQKFYEEFLQSENLVLLH